MRLLNTLTLQIEEFFDSKTPPYAILSHTWADNEVTFLEMQSQDNISHKAGFMKIQNFCTLAKKRGFSYGWVDTCCIDKRNNAELSEALNSMYRYYYNAAECLVYLEDVPAKVDEQLNAIKSSRWFTRGWTLQELIAPKKRYFFAQHWSPIEDSTDLVDVVADVASIEGRLLYDRDQLSHYCVAQRMSWAAGRKTTKSEDIAYCLMGLFNVNMPVLYGEGTSSAFKRLQHQIMQTSYDQTIFAWRANYKSSGLLAASPADFHDTPPNMKMVIPQKLSPFTMTNIGLSIGCDIVHNGDQTLAALHSSLDVGNSVKILMVYLERISDIKFYINGKSCKAYRRVRCGEWSTYEKRLSLKSAFEDILVLEDENYAPINSHILANKYQLGLVPLSVKWTLGGHQVSVFGGSQFCYDLVHLVFDRLYDPRWFITNGNR